MGWREQNAPKIGKEFNMPRKGVRHTPEAIEKMRMSHKGNIPWNKGKKGVQVGVWREKRRPPFSDEWKRKIGEALRKRVRSEETCRKLSLALRGKKKGPMPLETRRKISASLRGERSYSWKGGVAPIHKLIRKSVEYKIWRKAVYERDNYTCQMCGDNHGGNLEVDHIKPFALFPELRFEVSNGRTLCKKCHRLTATYGEGTRKLLPEFSTGG